jgi:cysteinyl-tRNA synthetase
VDFSDETVMEAERGLERLYATLAAVTRQARDSADAVIADKQLHSQDPELFTRVTELPDAFQGAMDNDFNTAQAIGYLFDLQRHLRRFLDRFGTKKLKGASALLALRAARILQQQAGILGLLSRDPDAFLQQQRRLKLKTTGLSEEQVEQFIHLRHEARKAQDFTEADRIREELAAKGVQPRTARKARIVVEERKAQGN